MKSFAPFDSDGYKLGHAPMYADGTTKVYSNLTPRSDRIYREKATKFYGGKLVFVGAQASVMEIVESWNEFFKMDKGIALARFKLLCDFYLGPDSVSIDQLSALHDLGYLPLEIKTLEEGTKVSMGIPVFTVTNTIDHAYWLVNFLETKISNLTWKSSTNATIAAEYKAMLLHYARKTGSPIEGVAFQAHDFSARGMSGPEDAARSGFGHICSFLGTDSLGSVLYAQDYYKAGDFVAASVPATEHAVATSNILKIENEINAGTYKFQTVEQTDIYYEMLDNNEPVRFIAEVMFAYDLMTRKFPKGILSYVMDSFDFWTMVSRGMRYLKAVIMRRVTNGITPGKLVARPDSGDPLEVICGKRIHNIKHEITSQEELQDVASDIGYAYAQNKDFEDEIEFFIRDVEGVVLRVSGYAFREYDYTMHFQFESIEEAVRTDEEKGAIEVLWETFGGTITATGHKLLDEHIGLIYGDSITTSRCLAILERLDEMGFASANVVFGVGSYTYQCNTRDSFGFAVKATYTEVEGNGIAIFKDPKTDSKKKSAKGLLYVGIDDKGNYYLEDNVSYEREQCPTNQLKVRFRNGLFFNQTTLEEIRAKL